jgi:CRP-like cAMP-binding protein
MKAVPAPSSIGLKRIALLEGLPQETLDRIARECAWRRYAAGQTLISRSSSDRDVFMVVSGRVRATMYARSGRQVTFRDVGEGETVGEIAATDGGPRSVDVVALQDVLAAVITAAGFRQLRHEHPEMAERFALKLVQLVRGLTDTVIELSTLGVQNRIHAELLRLARAGGAGPDANSRVVSPAPTHAELAARVSTTREQVTREMSTLAKSGLLEKTGHGLRVTDVRLLEQMVEQARRLA